MPFESALFAVDPDRQRVFLIDRDLAGVKHSARAALKAQENVRVIFERAPLHESREIRAELFDFKTRNVFGQVFGMSSDIAHAAGGPGYFGIHSPAGLLLSGRFDPGGKPTLRVFD